MHIQLINLFFILFIMLFTNKADAEHVLPVFSGYWYTDADLQYYDACEVGVYNYENMKSGDIQSYAQQMLSNVPSRVDCEWDEPHLMESYLGLLPRDFSGDLADWYEITQNPQAKIESRWGRKCKNKNGIILDSKSVLIFPSYICPAGSRYSYDQDSKLNGCSITPSACQADIFGRDLKTLIFGSIGHVGLGSQWSENSELNSSVVEVLHSNQDLSDGIYINNANDFKHTRGSSYWGEKYGILEKGILTSTDSLKIYLAALEQKKYPFKYTFGWDWHPGSYTQGQIYNQQKQRWENINAVTPAKFRCDSFVYYSYLTGAALHIFHDFVFPFVPIDMFDSFVACRDTEGTLCGMNHGINHFHDAPKIEQPFPFVFSFENINLGLADYLTEKFVKNKYISRSVKINQLWSMALRYQDNPEKFCYLIDSLEYLKPIELAPEVIQNFKEQKNSENKFHLLTMLISSLSYKEYSKQDLFMQIQNFLTELLGQSNDKKILRYVIRSYPFIFSGEKAKLDIEKALNRRIPHISSLLSKQEKMGVILDIAFSTDEQQKKLLPDLIRGNEGNEMFVYSLCSLLNELSPSMIDQGIKKELGHLLLSNRDAFVKFGLKPGYVEDRLPCNWLDAYATIMVLTHDEKDKFMLDYIRGEENIYLQATLLSQLKSRQINQIAPQDRSYYRKRFLEGMKQENILYTNKKILGDGITSLYTMQNERL